MREEDHGVPLRIEEQPDGHMLVRLQVGITDEMVRWLLGFGPDCRVLAPVSLRDRVHAMVEETRELYEKEAKGGM